MPEWITFFVNYFLHLDKTLGDLVANYHAWVYAIMFVVVFCETGLVVTPFLPGDSLLFTAGAIATKGELDPWNLVLVLGVAAVLGDAVNYAIGAYVGPKIFSRPKSRFWNPVHLRQAHEFYEKYGGKTIIIARFLPIFRTFAPFVAGIGSMSYRRFALYNVVGAGLWVMSLVWAGYWFADVPFVKNHFSMVILAIIVISVLPAVVEFLRGWRAAHKKA